MILSCSLFRINLMSTNVKTLAILIQKGANFWQDTHVLTFNGNSIADNTLSWPKYQSGLNFEHKDNYEKRHSKLHKETQFQIEFADTAFLQFYYLFDKNSKLINARIAYYPFHNSKECTELRFDFDFQSGTPLIHPICHLQIGVLPQMRLSCEMLPDPEVILEVIIRNFYFENWKKKFPHAANILENVNLDYDKKIINLNNSDYSKFMRELNSRLNAFSKALDEFSLLKIVPSGFK